MDHLKTIWENDLVFFIPAVKACYFSARCFISMAAIDPFLSHASSYAQKDTQVDSTF